MLPRPIVKPGANLSPRFHSGGQSFRGSISTEGAPSFAVSKGWEARNMAGSRHWCCFYFANFGMESDFSYKHFETTMSSEMGIACYKLIVWVSQNRQSRAGK